MSRITVCGCAQPGRIQQLLQHVLAVRQFRVERLNLLGLRLQLLVLLGKLLGLLREFFRLLREFLVEVRQFLHLLLLRDADRLGPAGAAEAFGQNAQEKTGAREDRQSQGVIRGCDTELPIRLDEPIIGCQRREHGGYNPRPASPDACHQQDRRVEKDEGRQRAERLHQPPLQRRGHGDDDHRGSVAKGDPAPHLCSGSGARRGGATQPHVAHQDHGRQGQHQQGDGHPQGSGHDGAVGAGVGRGTAHVEQVPLALLHCGNHAPQIIHDLLAPIAEDDRQGGLEARLPAEPDHLVQHGEPGVGQLADLFEALLLGRVIAGQLSQPVDIALDLAGRRLVRLQIRLLAGENEPALAGLGILEHGEEVLKALVDLVGVRHPAVRVEQSLRAHVEADSHRGDGYQPHGKQGEDFCSRTHRNCSQAGCSPSDGGRNVALVPPAAPAARR
jgi:hypothetical protein